MQQDKETKNQLAYRTLGEDWISVIIGLAIVLVVFLFSITSIPWPLFGVFA